MATTYKGYTITKNQSRGYMEVVDADGKVLVLKVLVIECKKYIDSITRKAKV